MKLTERQESIQALLRSAGRVEVEDLATRFGVTSQTIRRDLGELVGLGLASRTHGGARRLVSAANREYAQRRASRAPEKAAMAALTAALIPDDCSVALNIGTSTEAVARALSGHSGLVVVSNNINIINTLLGNHSCELVMMGGTVRQDDGAIVGEDAVDFMSRFKVDFAIIGASALDADGAVLDHDVREVSVARALLQNSRTSILVCDGSKFDRTAPVRICDLADLDYVVTDAEPPREFAAAAARAGTRILKPDSVANAKGGS